MTTANVTPVMQQWKACKKKTPEAILFFRLGDFYEFFHEDAEIVAELLNLTLTNRQGHPMAGVPVHMSEVYIDRLVAQGRCVAVAEQLTPSGSTKGIVPRDVVRFITPGTAVNAALLSEKESNFLATVLITPKEWGCAFIDISTGENVVVECMGQEHFLDMLALFKPKELLLSKQWKNDPPSWLQDILDATTSHSSHYPICTFKDADFFSIAKGFHILLDHFKVLNLSCFNIRYDSPVVGALGAMFTYLESNLHISTKHIRTLQTYDMQNCLQIDRNTEKHLEIISSTQGKEHTLLHFIDRTLTPMGGRLLRRWLLAPLLNPEQIATRHNTIEILLQDIMQLMNLRNALKGVHDIERTITRIEMDMASPRELIALRNSLQKVHIIRKELSSFPPLPVQKEIYLRDASEVIQIIHSALQDEPPNTPTEANLFKPGFHQELDQLYTLKNGSESWLVNYQKQLRQQTEIPNLKVGFSRTSGYYIEVTKSHLQKVPNTFFKKQTMTNAERFFTQELKNFEYKILSADAKIKQLQQILFTALREKVASYSSIIKDIAHALAKIDCFAGFAKLAKECNYTKPTINTSTEFNICKGRHPLIERKLGASFIPNNFFLNASQQVGIITGPNMAGKSTYLRSCALITIMAQVGSYVPAEKATLGIVDKIFSRIGASDNLLQGQSTFMVEMVETANILQNATSRSLVILDEIGRGTGTLEGLSIAWAIVEYLLTQKGQQARTLFATHYLELTELPKTYPQAFNLSIAVEQTPQGIVFLHSIQEGPAQESYGIHVAELAGLPPQVIQTAQEKKLSLQQSVSLGATPPPQPSPRGPETKISKEAEQCYKILTKIDPNTLSPKEALNLVFTLCEQVHQAK